MSSYPESVRYLYALGNEVATAKLGLERIRTLLDALGNPQDSFECVHAAGTNGKGSVCAMIASGLGAAGRRTGLYTSPHLVEPTERIQLNGAPVSRDVFTRAFDTVHQAAERLLAANRIDLHPTYFETVTAMAFVIFREAHVEAAVIETGLGGRLDATNIVSPSLAVITPIDYDHEAWLGRSLESIAAEKAGIIKPGTITVFAPQRKAVYDVLDKAAAEAGVSPLRLESWHVEDLTISPERSSFRAVGHSTLRIECPLAGEHQVTNALTAAVALDALNIPPEKILDGIREVRWPGRLERVCENPAMILDGAHNPSGARALAAYIERFCDTRRVTLIFGAMRDKAVEEMASILFPLAAHVIVTAPGQARAVHPEAALGLVDHPSLRIAPRLADALRMLEGADIVFITGSLFLVGEARALLVK